MFCPSCGIQILPYLQKCDICRAVVQPDTEALRQKKDWARLPEHARQEFINNIKESRAKSTRLREVKTRHLHEYMFIYGMFVFILTFLGDFIVRGGIWKGFLCALVGGLCGMAGCSALYRLGGRLVTGILVIPAAYVLSDFLKPGNSYALQIITLLYIPAVAPSGRSAAEPYGTAYTAGGYAITFLFSLAVFTTIGGIMGDDIKRKIIEDEL